MLFAVAALIATNAFAAKSNDLRELRKQVRRTLHGPQEMPALRAKTYGQFSPAPGIAGDRVSYYTDYDLRVPAIVYHQAGATISRHPALVIVNGQGGDKASSYAYWAGILYARGGAVVLTFDPIGEFERNKERRSGTRQHEEAVPPVEEMARRMSGLMVSDVLQAVHYLTSRKDVDDKRIAVLGFDAGSVITSVACAVETDIHACVLANVGTADQLLGEGGAAKVEALNAKRSFTYGDGHAAYFLTRPVALWLNEKLRFPDWTKKQILAMGETQMGELTALSNGGIAPVPRDDLRSVPDALWASEQESFIYETWVERAKAAVRTDGP